jgi:endonuclease YncB( thermonuclease family)
MALWLAVATAGAAVFSGGVTQAELERLARTTWRAITSSQHAGNPASHSRQNAPSQPDGTPITGLARIVDGDTLDIGGTRIRMRGIDALEHDQTCSRPGDTSYACGKLARDALVSLIHGATVTCVPDGTETYGRIVATCSVPGASSTVDLNSAMVRSGLAFDCPRFSDGLYASREREARSARTGAWAGRFDFPWAHRDRANACGRD